MPRTRIRSRPAASSGGGGTTGNLVWGPTFGNADDTHGAAAAISVAEYRAFKTLSLVCQGNIQLIGAITALFSLSAASAISMPALVGVGLDKVQAALTLIGTITGLLPTQVNGTLAGTFQIQIDNSLVTNFTVPPGVTSLGIKIWGSGGGGGTATVNGGGGGGGGAYSLKTVTVTPGQNCTIQLGPGTSVAQNGTDSFFIDTATVLAKAGLKGANGAAGGQGAGGAGGAAASGVGTTKFSGGAGGGGGGAQTSGGGGGGSAGNNSDGGAGASNRTAGTAGTGNPSGAAGGGGGGTSSASGQGLAPGGGGGGASATNVGSGGAGGRILILYTMP